MYRLKRDKGVPVAFYKTTSEMADPTTGDLVRSYEITKIPRALVFETSEMRSFVYDLTFLAANKNFAMGGEFETAERFVVIANGDMAADFNPTLSDYVFIHNSRYKIAQIIKLEESYITAFKVKELKGQVKAEVHQRISRDSVGAD